jgi:hypothetical protein
MSEDRKSLYLEKYKCEIGGARWQIIRRTPLTDALFITLVMDDDSIWRSNYDYWERLKAYRVELSN